MVSCWFPCGSLWFLVVPCGSLLFFVVPCCSVLLVVACFCFVRIVLAVFVVFAALVFLVSEWVCWRTIYLSNPAVCDVLLTWSMTQGEKLESYCSGVVGLVLQMCWLLLFLIVPSGFVLLLVVPCGSLWSLLFLVVACFLW